MAEKQKIKKILNRKEASEYFRNLASEIEKGFVSFGDKAIDIPDSFEFEIKIKEHIGKKEIEWEIEWKK